MEKRGSPTTHRCTEESANRPEWPANVVIEPSRRATGEPGHARRYRSVLAWLLLGLGLAGCTQPAPLPAPGVGHPANPDSAAAPLPEPIALVAERSTAARPEQLVGEGAGSQEGSGAEVPTGTGVVNAIDPSARAVNVSHEPIPALGWPAMTMDLGLAEGVRLEGIAAGSAVVFTLVRGSDGIYRIGSIAPRAEEEPAHGMTHPPPSEGEGPAPMDHGMGHDPGTHEER